MPNPKFLVALTAQTLADQGAPVVIDGQTVNAISRSITPTEFDFFRAGPDAEDAFSDLRVYVVSPVDLAALGLTVSAEMSLVDGDHTYIIRGVLQPSHIGAVAVEQVLICSLAPQNHSIEDAVQNAPWSAPPA